MQATFKVRQNADIEASELKDGQVALITTGEYKDKLITHVYMPFIKHKIWVIIGEKGGHCFSGSGPSIKCRPIQTGDVLELCP